MKYHHLLRIVDHIHHLVHPKRVRRNIRRVIRNLRIVIITMVMIVNLMVVPRRNLKSLPNIILKMLPLTNRRRRITGMAVMKKIVTEVHQLVLIIVLIVILSIITVPTT